MLKKKSSYWVRFRCRNQICSHEQNLFYKLISTSFKTALLFVQSHIGVWHPSSIDWMLCTKSVETKIIAKIILDMTNSLVNFNATEKLLAQSLHRKRLDYLIRCSLEQEWQFISMNCSMTKKFLFNGKKKSRRLSSTKELLYKIVCECIIYLNCSWQNNFIWN